MIPLPNQLKDRLRPLAAKAAHRARLRRANPGPVVSAYAQWHGQSPTASAASLVCTPVADIALLQGHGPVAATLQVEFEGIDELLPVTHRFPDPDGTAYEAVCFEMTLSASQVPGASRARLVVDGEAQRWVGLPTLPAPGAMTGVEALSECPACDGVDFAPTGRRQHLDMMTCQRCGLVMTSPRPAEDHTLVRYSERYFDEEYLPSQQETPALIAHIDAILDHAEPAKHVSAALFELGVGGGNLSARATERGWATRGTDVNPASIKHAAARGLDVWLENADHADSLGGTYGAIISEMSIEHVRHPEHFCALAAQALVPGGRLVIYTVSAEGESFQHSGMASPLVGPAEHLFLYSAGSLVSLCERAGLRVDTVWRNRTGDEVGVVAVKRGDSGNPAVPHPASSDT